MKARPCTIIPDPWAVTGSLPDRSGGGVLQWCYDAADARDWLEILAAEGYLYLRVVPPTGERD